MTREPTEEEIVAFERLVSMAAQGHRLTWCVKRQWSIHTLSLSGQQCLRCEHYMGQGGICDPL